MIQPTPLDPEPLFLLAMDHRASLAKTVYGIPGDPSPEQVGRLVDGKELVYDGLEEALRRGADHAHVGVLVDERYGAAVALRAHRKALRLAMPVEASGRDWFAPEYGTLEEDQWLDHAYDFDVDYVKVLVRDNPAFDAARRRRQLQDLARVSATLRTARRTLLLELLVPPTGGQESDDYDRAVRPELTRQVIASMQQAGVEPDIWKIEGLDRPEDAAAVVAATQQDGRAAVRCIVLGRDAPRDVLDHWLTVAAGVPGFAGFAIGRSIWEEPLSDHLAGRLDRKQAVSRIAENYLHFVRVYQAAR